MIDRPTWRHWAALALPPAACLVLYAFYAPDAVLIQPDSEGYLTFSRGRTGGYPAFLALLKPFMSDVAGYAIAQRVFYALAVLVLGYQLLRTFGSLSIALLAEVAVLFNPEVNRYHFSIITESVFLSTTALFIAAALAYLRTGGPRALFAASLIAAYAVTIRPTGLILVPLVLILLLAGPRLQWPQIWKSLLIALLPALIIMPLESYFYREVNAVPRVSLLPIHLLAKAGMVEAAEADSVISAAPADTKPLQRTLEAGLAPVRRLVAEGPNQGARCKLIVNYEVFVQYEFALKEREAAIGRGSPALLTDIALARLKNAVGDYLRLTSDHLQCLWSLGAATKQEQLQFADYLESRRPLPFEKTILGALAGSRSPPFATAVLIVMYSIAALLLVAVIGLIAALLRRRQAGLPLAMAGFCGVFVHGTLLLTAMTGVGEPRYVLGLWVPIAIGLGMSLLWIMGSAGFSRVGQAGMRR